MAMSSVLNLVPRVVHFSDVKAREIYVAGRDLHFVCGVSSTEYVDQFGFKKTPRKHFSMYPEEVLGAGIQSATIMWERVEAVFQGIREVMVKSGNARSGSFSMPWTSACMAFFEVCASLFYILFELCFTRLGHE